MEKGLRYAVAAVTSAVAVFFLCIFFAGTFGNTGSVYALCITLVNLLLILIPIAYVAVFFVYSLYVFQIMLLKKRRSAGRKKDIKFPAVMTAVIAVGFGAFVIYVYASGIL